MSPVRATIQAEMDLFHAVEQFLGCNFPTLPVVEDDRLVGRLSRKELLRAVQRFVSGYEKTRRQRIQVAAAGAQRPKSIEAMQRSAGRLSREVLADLFSRFR
jgi:CBS-domain-containing membrane protein